MDQNASMEEGKVSKYGLEFMKSVSDKNLDLLRPSARCFSMFKGKKKKQPSQLGNSPISIPSKIMTPQNKTKSLNGQNEKNVDAAGYTTNSDNDKYTLIRDDADDFQQGIYDKPLPCFGCGVGWFSFLLGFAFPLMWYYATFLYFGNYYKRDPRERAGLAASAIAAMGFSVVVLIIGAILLF